MRKRETNYGLCKRLYKMGATVQLGFLSVENSVEKVKNPCFKGDKPMWKTLWKR